MSWAPLSVRRGRRAPFEHVDGVPPHLATPLLKWVDKHLLDEGRVRESLLDAVIVRLQLPIVDRSPYSRYAQLVSDMHQSADLFLDVIDMLCVVASDRRCEELNDLLDAGLSIHRVRMIKPRGLEERVGDEARAAVVSAASHEDRAGEEIGAAWALAYGRDRDATAAWNAAVKAIEFLLKPIVEPTNDTARLGGMMAALRRKPEKWTFSVAAAGGDTTARPFLQALELIGYEPGRHGTDPKRATIEQARVVVLQAVTIVEWLRSGALSRVG